MQSIVLFSINIKVCLSMFKFIVILLFTLYLLKIQDVENKIISNKESRNYLRLLIFII
ncbi:hypothetical protein SAMN05421800_103231 [Chryseobacterium balustinum]|uniref:Uncharacterized protein n=1 Tax=Chryseobacterium balustinum TaxID=246 RepID=A0AAX2IKD8_9FLAO|nr:hypothetical protein SAMN05421800_103231 [Chryseobacterium balustinum]SQA89684.1 Uncharacterised protein [Chryseobacterium balustinum]